MSVEFNTSDTPSNTIAQYGEKKLRRAINMLPKLTLNTFGTKYELKPLILNSLGEKQG